MFNSRGKPKTDFDVEMEGNDEAMRASECFKGFTDDGTERDELAELVADGKLDSRIRELDTHWGEVMRLCEESGFIIQAYGGTAVISTNEVYRDANGAKELARRLRMCDVEL